MSSRVARGFSRFTLRRETGAPRKVTNERPTQVSPRAPDCRDRGRRSGPGPVDQVVGGARPFPG
ncbi:hypothetical protein ACFFX0_31840 [Citricoccus parietis]|uniref:Uncharacterized protein n=1 Tax=Citricoccus parietis TaxID=592307 RepID=A0ABV5GAN3_9MICC